MLAVIRLHAFVGMVDDQEYVGSLDNFIQSPDMYLYCSTTVGSMP